MAEVVISSVLQLLLSTANQQISDEIKLVRGVDEELSDLSKKLTMVINVLDDAEMKQFKEKTVKDWLRRLELTSEQMEDVLEEWKYAIVQHTIKAAKHKVCSLIPSSCFFFKKLVVRHDIANEVQNLKSRLDKILNEKDGYHFVISQPTNDPSPASWRVQSTSLMDLEEVQGRKYDMEFLVKKDTAREGLSYQVLSIVGVGGLGKTTLAKQVYNDSRVQQCFDFRIWICVSDPFNVVAITKGIIKAIDEQGATDDTQLEALVKKLIGYISGKKILLVLDDVWNEHCDKWEPLENALKCGGADSRILVTTRKKQVATIMGSIEENIYCPDVLSEEDCRKLFMRTALYGRSRDEFEYFQEIGKKIAEKCNGLPLAAKTLGSALRFRRATREWDNILKSKMWELEEAELGLFPHLLLSYHELSPSLKRCFSFCAFFHKDEPIAVNKLIRIWMALGYLDSNNSSAGENMEFRGRRFFDNLAMRSLFQDFEKDDYTEQIGSCKMHDIVHDFAQYLRKSSTADALGMISETCQVCKSSLVSQAQEYRSLFWNKESPANLCDCLASLRVLQLRRVHNPQGMDKLIHLKWLDISYTALSMGDLKIICKLYFLQTLLLACCSIKEIPGEIENLVYLRFLDLRYNHELNELPENMRSLAELQTLLLSSCSLEEFPGEIKNLAPLKHLELHGNLELKKLPENICSLAELKTLLSSMCSLKEIPRDIGNLTHLT